MFAGVFNLRGHQRLATIQITPVLEVSSQHSDSRYWYGVSFGRLEMRFFGFAHLEHELCIGHNSGKNGI